MPGTFYNHASFDDIDRVTQWDRDNATESQTWTLDKIGNWQSTTGSLAGNSFNESRAHNDVHELTSISGSSGTLAYDDKGNMTTDANSNTLVWDIDIHLQSMVINGSSVTLAYDALGRRLEKSDGTNSTLFISDGQRVIEEYEDAGSGYALARSYTYGTYVDDVVAKVEAVNTPTVLYYHSDRQFNVRGLTDSSGAIKELYAYSVYGQQTIVSSTGSNNNNYGFTGRYLDSETGLWYFRARYFSDEMGRFISRDPLGYVDGMSLYAGYFAWGFNLDPWGSVTADSAPKGQGAEGLGYYDASNSVYRLSDRFYGMSVVGMKLDGECEKCSNYCYKYTGVHLNVKFFNLINVQLVNKPNKSTDQIQYEKEAGITIKRIYGHEQLHLKHMINKYKEIRSDILNRLEFENLGKFEDQCMFKSLSECENKLDKYKRLAKINVIWKNMRIIREAGSGHDKPGYP